MSPVWRWAARDTPGHDNDLNADSNARAPLAASLALGLLGLAWVVPFFSPNFQEPIGSFYGEVAAIVLGLVAVGCLLARPLWAGLVIPRASLVFLGFMALILLHFAIGRSVYLQQNLMAVLYLLWALALSMLAWRLREVFGEERLVATLCWFLLAGSLLSCAIGLCQALGIRSPLSPFMLPQLHGRIYANTGQPNHLANYLCLGLASLAYLFATRRLGVVAAIAALVPLLGVMGMSGSRSVWFYVPMLLVLAAIFHFRLRTPATKRLLGLSIGALAGLALALVLIDAFAPQAEGSFGHVLQRVAVQGMGSSVRLRQWYEAWLTFLGAPVLGAGYRMFAWHQFLLNAELPPPRLMEGVVDNAHNLVMHTLAEFGLAGLAVLAGGIGAWIAGLRRVPMSLPLWWMLALAAILGIHSMLEYPLWYAYFLGIAAAILGMSERRSIAVGDPRRGRLVLVASLLLGWMALVNLYQDYRTLQALHRIERTGQSGAQEGRNTADELLQLQQHSLFTPFVELALSRLMVLDAQQIGEKVAFNEAVMHFTPSPDVTYRQAILLGLAGKPAEARAQWDLARKNFPDQQDRSLGMLKAAARDGSQGLADLVRYAEAGGDGKP
jgi:O-antigen ligase